MSEDPPKNWHPEPTRGWRLWGQPPVHRSSMNDNVMIPFGILTADDPLVRRVRGQELSPAEAFALWGKAHSSTCRRTRGSGTISRLGHQASAGLGTS